MRPGDRAGVSNHVWTIEEMLDKISASLEKVQ